MTDAERAALLSMLAVRVTLTEARECPRRDGRASSTADAAAATGSDRCRGLRRLVDVRIEAKWLTAWATRWRWTDGRIIWCPCRPRSGAANAPQMASEG